MNTLIGSLGHFVARHRWTTVGAWVVIAALVFGSAWVIGPALDDDIAVGGSDSQIANDLLLSDDSGEQLPSSRIVIAGAGITAEAELVADIADELATASGHEVVNPLLDPEASARAGLIAPDGEAIVLAVEGDPAEEGREWPSAIDSALEPARDAGYEVGIGAPLGTTLDRAGTVNSELVGVIAALVVLLIALGSALAALLPIATGIIAVAAGVGLVWHLSHGIAIPETAVTLAIMVGLGVGIDYSLFLLSRFRGALAEGIPTVEAVRVASGHAGEAAAVAGLTVAACATGLAISGVDFVAWLGYATALVVLIAVAAALTLAPALLAIIGPRALSLRTRRRGQPTTAPTTWTRMAGAVTARPILTGAISLVVLLAISSPALSLQLGQSSSGNALPGSNQRVSFDLTAEHWGAGENAVLLVAGETEDEEAWMALATSIASDESVASVSPPRTEEGVTTLRVTPVEGPSATSTAELVERLRTDVIAESDVDAHIGGNVATRIDLSERISERLPWLIAAVLAASMVLVAFSFRSILLPIKAALINLLSISAAFGVLVWVFQEGNGVALFGLDGPVPLDPYVPMMLFAVLFGLSMDYEVFLLTAVRERWRAGDPARVAVARGLAETGGVITAAAVIMVAVFLSFTFNPNPTIKVFGLGLAVAVFLDATVIRLLLVPSIMSLMGRAAWYWPGTSRQARLP